MDIQNIAWAIPLIFLGCSIIVCCICCCCCYRGSSITSESISHLSPLPRTLPTLPLSSINEDPV